MRETENAFLRYGMHSLLVSKFVPAMNTVAARRLRVIPRRRTYGSHSMMWPALAAAEDLFIVDVRSRVAQEPALIPGTLYMWPEELTLEARRFRETAK